MPEASGRRNVSRGTAQFRSGAALPCLLPEKAKQTGNPAVPRALPELLRTEPGPCLEACCSGEPLRVEDVAAGAAKWPRFAEQATAAGFRSVQALPLRLRKQVIGTLNLFGQGPDPVSGPALTVARALADVATIGILQERAIRRGELLAEQLQHALNGRVVIEQAKAC